MNRSLVGLLATIIISCASPVFALGAEVAKVTLTVTQFRPLTSLAENRYVDATSSLEPHATVRMEVRDGMPTFICKEAVDFEITVASSDSNETYVPLAVTFQQLGEFSGSKRDKSGAINFERLPAAASKLLFRNKMLLHRLEGSYEFFVLIQRASDGVLGLIDPTIVNNPI